MFVEPGSRALNMQDLLQELGFSIGPGFRHTAGLMYAAQRYRLENGGTTSNEITRATALAVVLFQSPKIRNALESFGLQYSQYLSSIHLKFPIASMPLEEIEIQAVFQEAIVRYASSPDAVLEASDEVIAIVILEDASRNVRSRAKQYELEPRLRVIGVDFGKLLSALRARTLPFDPRRPRPDQDFLRQKVERPVAAGQLEHELEIYSELLRRSPDDQAVRSGMAGLLQRLGRTTEAAALENEIKTNESASDLDDVVAPTAGGPPRKNAIAPFYSDHPAQKDLLNRQAVAETIATMIASVWDEDVKEENADRSFMVHLHGRWGSGKSSILNFLKSSLLSRNSMKAFSPTKSLRPSDPAWIIVDYNAWRNQNLGPAWWTLTEGIYRQARSQLSGWARIRLILRDRWWRITCSYAPYSLLSALALALVLSVIWLWRNDLFGEGKSWLVEGLKMLGSMVGVAAAVFAFGLNYQVGSARTAKSYLELSRDPLNPLTKRFGDLIEEIGRPVAVFVDDLDRCNAEFVVELLQTIQTLFRRTRVLYVVAADRDWVCASYQYKYEEFSGSLGEPGKSLGHLFIEKVFQLSIEVPRLTANESNAYWDALINARLIPPTEQIKGIEEEIAAEMEKAETEMAIVEIVERHQNDPIRAGIAASKGFQRMQSPALLREREHFLSGYAHLVESNPRAMKRLLNAYGFRRGFEIQALRRSDPDALVRWTILENRWPILADYLEGRSGAHVEAEIINALMKSPDVAEVAKGLTWEKIRPVASAPDRPPARDITPGAETKS
jgi:hypothetical protein